MYTENITTYTKIYLYAAKISKEINFESIYGCKLFYLETGSGQWVFWSWLCIFQKIKLNRVARTENRALDGMERTVIIQFFFKGLPQKNSAIAEVRFDSQKRLNPFSASQTIPTR